MYSNDGGPTLKLNASRLPGDAKLEDRFGVIEYSSLSTLRSRFFPTAFNDLGDRELQIVPADRVGISYLEQDGSPASYHPNLSGYNVVVSFPKSKDEQVA